MADRAALRRAGWIALAVAVVLCVAGIVQHGLWTPDEPREAEVGREMLDSHFSAMPTLGGVAFLEKPPLYAWITAASYSVFGVSAGAARIPAAIFSIGAIVVAYLLGKRAAGRLAGLCSAIVLGTTWQFAETSHKAVLDTALTFFVAAGHLAFLRPRDERRASNYVAIGVLSGLAFLTKAWIGPALLCAPPILAAAAMRDWECVKRVLPRAFVAATLGVAAFGLPWMLALAHTPGGGWAAVKECLVTEYVGRTVGAADFSKQGHQNPPWYYTYTALVVVAPWVLALPAMLKGSTLSRTWRGGRTAWCALVFIAGVAMLSLPSGKRELYVVPLLPAASVVAGVWLSRVGSRRAGAWDARTATLLSWLVVVLAFAVSLGVVGWGAVASNWWRTVGTGTDAESHLKLWVDSTLLFTCVAVGVAGVAALTWTLRRAGRTPSPSSFRLATAMTVLFACLHFGARPLLDEHRNMRVGVESLVAGCQDDARLLALSADETTLAVVPFYSGRILENFEDAAEALKALDSGAAKHLIVMDKEVRKLTPSLKRRLDVDGVRTVKLSATRDVNVYAVKP